MRRESRLNGKPANSRLAVLLLIAGIGVMISGAYLMHANPSHNHFSPAWHSGSNTDLQFWQPQTIGFLLLIVGAVLAVSGPFTSFLVHENRSPSPLRQRTSFWLSNGWSWFVTGFTRNTMIVMTIFAVLFIAKNVIPYPPNKPGIEETIYYDIPVRRLGMPFVWFEGPDMDHAFYHRSGVPRDRWESSYFSRGFVARGLLLNLLFFVVVNGGIYWLFRRQAIMFIDHPEDHVDPDERDEIRYL